MNRRPLALLAVAVVLAGCSHEEQMIEDEIEQRIANGSLYTEDQLWEAESIAASEATDELREALIPILTELRADVSVLEDEIETLRTELATVRDDLDSLCSAIASALIYANSATEEMLYTLQSGC